MTQIYHISCFNPEKDNNIIINKAIEFLRHDGIIAMPSDTLYGLFAACKPALVERLHDIKKRNHDKPFLLVFPERLPLDSYLDLPRIHEDQKNAMKAYWPGRNTLILPKNPGLDYPAGESIAIRKPDKKNNPFFYEVLNRFDGPLLAPSLNLHSQKPLSSLDLILEAFGESIDAVFFDENFRTEAASSIIDLTVSPFRVLR